MYRIAQYLAVTENWSFCRLKILKTVNVFENSEVSNRVVSIEQLRRPSTDETFSDQFSLKKKRTPKTEQSVQSVQSPHKYFAKK